MKADINDKCMPEGATFPITDEELKKENHKN
jgi:hypothetical protein